MHRYWVRILLLATFAYWATGTAKYVHEAVEHHGHDASIDDDDDAVLISPSRDHSSPLTQSHDPKHKHPCPICQMLAATAVVSSSPPIILAPTLDVVAILSTPHWRSPVVRPAFTYLTTGPPIV